MLALCLLLKRRLLEILRDIRGGVLLLLQLGFSATVDPILQRGFLGRVGGALFLVLRRGDFLLLQTGDLLLGLFDVLFD